MSAIDSSALASSLNVPEGAVGTVENEGPPQRSRSAATLLSVSRRNLYLEPVASLLILLTVQPDFGSRQVALWLILVSSMAVLRVLLRLHIKNSDPTGESLQEWGLATSASAGLAGAFWASGLPLLWPAEAGSGTVFLVLIVVTVSAAATALTARHLPAAMTYLSLALATGSIGVVMQQLADPLNVALMSLVIGAGLISLALLVNRLHNAQDQLQGQLDAAFDAVATANQAKTEFVANISHELRTPLNAINGFSAIISEQTLGPINNPKYADYAHDIHESGERLLEVINDILDLSRLETGNMELAREVLEVAPFIQSAVNQVEESAEKAGVRLSIETVSDSPQEILADKRLLKQVLINLLSNAIKFTPLGGEVIVEARYSQGRGLQLTVSDNGIGMATENIDIALTPFGQADGSLSRSFEGAGLGLPLVKSLVELHGGDIRLHSEPSIGTKAIVTLPESCVVK